MCCTPFNNNNVVERPPKHPSKKASIVKKNNAKEIESQINIERKNIKIVKQDEPASPPSQKRSIPHLNMNFN